MVRGPTQHLAHLCMFECPAHHRVVTSYEFVYYSVSIQINYPAFYVVNAGQPGLSQLYS